MIKLKDKEFGVYLPQYGYEVIFIESNNILKSRKNRESILGKFKKTKGDEFMDGLHSHKDPYKSYIFLLNKPEINVLSHECYHATCKIFKWIGAKKVDEEVFAYNLGYLIGEAYKFYYK